MWGAGEPARAPKTHASLPFACSGCGSCAGVCPVAIDLPQLLIESRAELVRTGQVSKGVRRGVSWMNASFRGPRRYRLASALLRGTLRMVPQSILQWAARPWAESRSLPEPAPETFRTWWHNRHSERES